MQNGKPIQSVCGAKTRSGEPCKNFGMTNGRCRMHGGASPLGLAHAHTKHGRYSKDLPTRLASRYQEALNDPQLGMLHSEIALLDTRIAEMMAGLDTEQYGNIWKQVSSSYYALKAAMSASDKDGTIKAMSSLDIVIKRGYTDTSTWDSIVGLIEQRRKLTDSERKRQVDLEQMMTAGQAILLATTLVGILKEHVTDRKLLNSINTDIQKVFADA